MASEVSIPPTVTRREQYSQDVKYSEQVLAVGYALMAAEQETMGERLRRLRQVKGWSLAQAAKAWGTSRTAVWKAEKGETLHIHYPTLERIAEAYGTDVPYIVWGPDRSPDSSKPRSPPVDRSGRFKKL